MPLRQKLTLNSLVCLCKSCSWAAFTGRAASPSMQSSHWKAVDITSPNFLWPDWYSSDPAFLSFLKFCQYFRRSATFFWTAASKTREDPGSLVTTANGRGVYHVDFSGWTEITKKFHFISIHNSSDFIKIRKIVIIKKCLYLQEMLHKNSANRNTDITSTMQMSRCKALYPLQPGTGIFLCTFDSCM